jgi:hypothetical protein
VWFAGSHTDMGSGARLVCRRYGHERVQRIAFTPDELRNFAVCRICGALDGEYFTSTANTAELGHGRHRD